MFLNLRWNQLHAIQILCVTCSRAGKLFIPLIQFAALYQMLAEFRENNSFIYFFFPSVFAECHPFVSPDNFYRGCVFDSCHVSNPTVECMSLQTYAAACAQVGVCLHWRNYTKLCGKQPLSVSLLMMELLELGNCYFFFCSIQQTENRLLHIVYYGWGYFKKTQLSSFFSSPTASDCPSNKVYKPCGPAEQPTCEDK